MCDPFIKEAIRRAEARGLYPDAGQRDVDWDLVKEWAQRVQHPDFKWLSEPEMTPYSDQYIHVSRNGAICSGQHRILGGLMGNNPVPDESITVIDIDCPMRPWK